MSNTKYTVGQSVFFRKYGEGKSPEDKVFRPGSSVEVTDIRHDEESGLTLYTISKQMKSGEVASDVVSEAELKPKKPRLSKEGVKASLEKDKSSKEKKAQTDEEKTQRKETARIEKSQQALLSNKTGESSVFIVTEELQEALDQNDNNPALTAKSLWKTSQGSYFRLGGALASLYLDRYELEKAGYVGRGAFDNFITNEIPGMHSRRGRVFMEVYVRATNLEIPEKEICELGWTVAQLIFSVATEKNVHQLIQYAKQNNGEALRRFIKEEEIDHTSEEAISEEKLIASPEEIVKMKHMRISLFEDQFDAMQSVLQHVWQQYPEYDQNISQGLAIIVTEYAHNLNVSNKEGLTQDQFIQYGEGTFPGKEVFLRDKTTGEAHNPRYDYGQVAIQTAKKQQKQDQDQEELVTV